MSWMSQVAPLEVGSMEPVAVPETELEREQEWELEPELGPLLVQEPPALQGRPTWLLSQAQGDERNS